MIDTEFGGELERLTDLFVAVCERERWYRDYTRTELREALRETAAAFPVYRTYVDPQYPVRNQDVRYVQEAIATARSTRTDLDGELFDLLSEILLLRVAGPEAEALAVRFQQTTGPVVAKGVEDTLFYRFNRLISLNEVGGDPGLFGLSPDEFHAQNGLAQERWPLTMLASSTHDTKRSEDVRSRIGLLSEIPELWAESVDRWAGINAKHKRGDQPERNVEYLLYQTLVGAWPLGVRRATVFMQKAIREAKVHTSWIARNPTYEAAVHGFTERVLGDRDFQDALEEFVKPLVHPGRITSLAQTLIKLTSPGVPDFYQGCELWDFSLVDPDNRRRVDYGQRMVLLNQVKAMDAGSATADWEAGTAKMFLIHRALSLRAKRPSTFGADSTYAPLTAGGRHADRVVAYLRGDRVISVAPRLVMGLLGSSGEIEWDNTSLALPPGRWTDHLGGDEHTGTVALDTLLRDFSVALLERLDEPDV
jgi:(1->4)-alpha-D-glucan 1-alpha-D-glucosylmutase